MIIKGKAGMDGSDRHADRTKPMQLTPVFLLPGLFGDEPKLVDLRRHLSDQVAFVTLKLPDIESSTSLLSDLNAIGQSIADEIMRRQPVGAISIAGYSFGASAALAVATRLRESNRTLGYLCILDGAFEVDDLRRSYRSILLFGLTPRGALANVRRIIQKIRDRQYLRRARRFPEDLATSQPVRRAFIAYYRHLALDGWDPQACQAQGTLILSTTLGPANRPRWLKLCPNLRFVQSPSNHDDLIVGQSLDLVVSAIGKDFAAWAATSRDSHREAGGLVEACSGVRSTEALRTDQRRS